MRATLRALMPQFRTTCPCWEHSFQFATIQTSTDKRRSRTFIILSSVSFYAGSAVDTFLQELPSPSSLGGAQVASKKVLPLLWMMTLSVVFSKSLSLCLCPTSESLLNGSSRQHRLPAVKCKTAIFDIRCRILHSR